MNIAPFTNICCYAHHHIETTSFSIESQMLLMLQKINWTTQMQQWRSINHIKIVQIIENCLQDLLTEATAKCGWWTNSNEILSEGSRVPNRQRRFRATPLCSATCSIRRSSAILSGSLAKWPRNSFASLWAFLKLLCTANVCDMWCWSKVVGKTVMK